MGHTLNPLTAAMDLHTLHVLLNQTLRPGQQPLPPDLAGLGSGLVVRQQQTPGLPFARRNGLRSWGDTPRSRAARIGLNKQQWL